MPGAGLETRFRRLKRDWASSIEPDKYVSAPSAARTSPIWPRKSERRVLAMGTLQTPPRYVIPAEVSPSDLRIRRVQSRAPLDIHWAWDSRRWFSILRICTCWRQRMPETRIADRATTSNAVIMATPVWVFLVALVACAALVRVIAVLAFPCFALGLLASPLCGAALTFFAAAKKVSKESG